MSRRNSNITYFFAILFIFILFFRYIGPYIRDDKMILTYRVHDDIKKRYLLGLELGLIPQYDLIDGIKRVDIMYCPLQKGCECWLYQPSPTNYDFEEEIGGWHKPTNRKFNVLRWPEHFAIIDVKKIKMNVYSILSCEANWFAWKPA